VKNSNTNKLSYITKLLSIYAEFKILIKKKNCIIRIEMSGESIQKITNQNRYVKLNVGG
jgi:hypothetical protein